MQQLKQSPTYSENAFPCKNLGNTFQGLEPTFEAILFDLFDTLVRLDDEHKSYTESLRKTHEYLSANGLDCSFNVSNMPTSKQLTKSTGKQSILWKNHILACISKAP